MEFRDYYKVLGVERGASADAIKTAYRRLARKYHPDVSKEANAEARFKEVQEAYEVLKDPQKRAAYDELGSEWKSGQQFRPPPDWGSGFEFAGGAPGGRGGRAAAAPAAARRSEQDFSEFFSSLFGGGSPFAGAERMRAGGRDHHARIDIDLEEAFRGTTRTLELRHPEVKPDGTVELRTRTVRVSIPAGVDHGTTDPARRPGRAVRRRGRAGDLYLEMHILPHRLYQLDSRDVTLTFPVAPWEAVLGAAVTVPTWRPGRDADSGGQPVRTEAAPARPRPAGSPPGDQYVQLKVILPGADRRRRGGLQGDARQAELDPRAAQR